MSVDQLQLFADSRVGVPIASLPNLQQSQALPCGRLSDQGQDEATLGQDTERGTGLQIFSPSNGVRGVEKNVNAKV